MRISWLVIVAALLVSGCSNLVREQPTSSAAPPPLVPAYPAPAPSPVPYPTDAAAAPAEEQHAPIPASGTKKTHKHHKKAGAAPAAEAPPTDVVPAPLPKPTVPVATSTALVDEIVGQLQLGNIAFNTPIALNIEDTVTIHLAISQSAAVPELKKLISENGAVEGAQVLISNDMEAHLSGAGFKITPVTQERQAVSSNLTEWKWDITPTAEGHQQLHLSLDAIITVHDASLHRTIRTFDKPIEVQVTPKQRVLGFVRNNWQWLWTALLLPIGGWLWKKRRANSLGMP